MNYTSKTNKLIKKRQIRFGATRGGRWKEEELDEGGQKVKTPSYKVNKYYGYNLYVRHDKGILPFNMIDYNTAVCFIRKLLRKQTLGDFLFLKFCINGMMDVHQT